MPEPKRPFEIDPAFAPTETPNLAVASKSAQLAAQTLTETRGEETTPSVPSARTIVGSLLAHYQVEKLLGKGGMGEVYLATDIALDRKVALKLLPEHSARDPVYRERFLREARAQARLGHPNICHIYFVGEQNDQLFFTMELVEGETLSERLERSGPIPPAEAIELCRMAALGLREAHRHGYTHRDIKPSNLIVDKQGVLKLVDFGIAKHETAADGGIEGTPYYMSPEQARGEKVDFRSDIYALGVTLHQLITGKAPFVGETPAQILSQQISSTRPRLALEGPRPQTHDAVLLDELCDRMMAKRPSDRFASYDELLVALERLSPSMTREAGFWVRFAATAFDFLFVLMLALPAMMIVESVLPNSWRDKLNGFVVFAVASLYEIAAHARSGQTWGKRLFEIEVVRNHLAGRVGWRAAAVRFLVQWGLSIGAIFGLSNVDSLHLGAPYETIVNVALGLLLVFGPLGFGALAMRRYRRATVWDVVAGTRVLYRRVAKAPLTSGA